MTDTAKKRKPLLFALIGAANTAIDFGILFVLKQLGVPVVFATISSTTVAFIFSFIMNRKYTFKTAGGNVKRELALFIAVTLFGLWVLQNIVIWLVLPLIKSFGLPDSMALLGAKLAATVVSLVWNYVMYDRVVFKHKGEV